MCHLKGFKYFRSAHWSALTITNTCFPCNSYEKAENMFCFVQLDALVYKLLSAIFAGNCTKVVKNILSKHRV